MGRKNINKYILLRQFQRVLSLLVYSGLVFFAFLWMLSACEVKRSTTILAAGTETIMPVVSTSTQTDINQVVPTSTFESQKPVLSETSTPKVQQQIESKVTATQTPTSTGTETVVPVLTVTPSPTLSDLSYPGPIDNTPFNPETYPGPYEGPQEPGGNPYSSAAGGIFGAGGQSNPTVPPTLLTATATISSAATPIQRPTATPLSAGGGGNLPPRFLPKTGTNVVISIWHSLEYPQLAALEDIIRSFQVTFPQVSFELTYVPLDDLQKSYTDAVYLKKGPNLLLAPSDWAVNLYDQGLVADLKPYFPVTFWREIIQPALETGQYRRAQVSLPVTMSGVILYRNVKILPQPFTDFEAMVTAALKVTRGGIVGAYFELDPFYSMAHLNGLGGQWQDASGQPVFQRWNYADALNWLAMLQDFDRLGAVEMNTSRDLSLFRQGKVGLIIDGSWNMGDIALDLGRENLAVDIWPQYGTGRLSGYVFTQGLYLNVETAAEVDSQLLAALQFMGTVLLPQSQQRLAEEGSYLPVLQNVQILDGLKSQAVLALKGGSAFPAVLNGKPFTVYRSALQIAISQAMGLPPEQPRTELEALQQAYMTISDWFSQQNK